MEQIILNGKLIGFVENNIYIFKRNPSQHFYIKGRGYPITNDILKKLKVMGVMIIRIIEDGSKQIKVYETTLEKYQNAVLIQEGQHVLQRCVPLKELKCIDIKNKVV